MKIFGVDFTSAPNRRKPIVCVEGEITGQTLHIHRDIKIASLNEFEVFLKRKGPWIAGFDFPFGQPRQLVENLQWPNTWADYVANIAVMSQVEFEETIAHYRQSRPKGDKHHLRATDKKANALSPMMLHGVPVGKMFFKGVPRLLRASISILPCHPTDDNRIALEAYPALVARRWLDKTPYKSDTQSKQNLENETARRQLIEVLQSEQPLSSYNIRLELKDTQATDAVNDPTGDYLDAVLCAIQAAWAYTQRENDYGIPAYCDPLEGWIIDPKLL
jgi:hypothetical protein